MLKRIKKLCLTLSVFGLIAAPVGVSSVAFATSPTTNNIQQCLGSGSNLTVDTDGSCTHSNVDDGSTSISKILKLIINVFSAIVGFIAVVMIIFGGVKYITSGGESSNISGAKNTIVYAIIGLIIVALAQVLVHFVLSNIGKST